MKKGLLSILAASLLVVGCQDYDDQFSSLESQISALATTVAGLSQVQSDLASLSGTVASLASTVNGLGDQIDTAVSSGLSDIQADIDAIETAVADVASSEEVSTLSDAVSDAQDDLTDLLAASSVFTGDVVVNSVNTLDAYLAMGAALNIVNGSVDITVSTAMDQTKVQALVDNILTIVQDLKYTSAASSIAETTFDNLTGVQSLTITQGGGMRFPNLISATNVFLKDDFESTVSVIHFGSLTSVSGIDTDAETNTIRFTKATELHLTSLKYYPGGTLTIETDEGAAMPFVLDDIDADGDTLTNGLTLTITGPASFSSSQIADGTLDFTDVKTVSLTDYKGAVTIGGDVESFTSNSLVSLSIDSGTKVETVDVTGVVDPDATTAATKLGPTIALSSLGDLETVTIGGIAKAVTLSTNNNLTSATITADVSGAIVVDNNSDLTTLAVTGATASALDIDTNADLTAVTVDLTWGNSGTGTTVDGDLDVTGNLSLESLTVSSNNLENLEITGNTSLAKVDFTGVKAIGATGTAVVNVYNNDLTASKLTDKSDGTTDVADGKAGDLGSVTSTSGMDTMSDYLTAVAADTDSAAAVYWDKVESFVDSEGTSDSETTDISYSSATAQDATTILLLSANTADLGDAATTTKRSYLIPNGVTAMSVIANGIDLLGTTTIGNTNASAATSATLGTSNAVTIAALVNTVSLAQADVAGVSIAATGNAAPVVYLEVGKNSSNAENSATAATGANNWTFQTSDTFTFTLDGLSATVTGTAYTAAGGTTPLDLLEALTNAWHAKYGAGGTDSGASVGSVASETALRWTISSDTDESTNLDNPANARLIFTAKDTGSGSVGAQAAATFTASEAASSTVGFLIGNGNSSTRSAADNVAQGTGVVLTITADTAGSLLNQIGSVLAASPAIGAQTGKTISVQYTSGNSATMVSELNSTYNPNITASNITTATNVYPEESRRNDVAIGAEANNAAASNAVSFSRVGWLSS